MDDRKGGEIAYRDRCLAGGEGAEGSGPDAKTVAARDARDA